MIDKPNQYQVTFIRLSEIRGKESALNTERAEWRGKGC